MTGFFFFNPFFRASALFPFRQYEFCLFGPDLRKSSYERGEATFVSATLSSSCRFPQRASSLPRVSGAAKKVFFLLREIFCFPLSLCPVANGVFFFLSHTWRKKERVLLPLIFPHQSFFFFLSSFLDASLLLSPVAVLLFPLLDLLSHLENTMCAV